MRICRACCLVLRCADSRFQHRGIFNPETFTRGANLKIMLIALAGILAGQGVVWYTAQFYTEVFLEHIVKIKGDEYRTFAGRVPALVPFIR